VTSSEQSAACRPFLSETLPFSSRWASLVEERSNLVLAATPSSTWLCNWSLSDDLRGAAQFCESVLSVVDSVAAVKIQVPHFERFGPDGVKLLAWFIARAKEAGTLAIADSKRCDAPDTMAAYAETYIGQDSVIGADAMTVVPYMGVSSFGPLAELARDRCASVFVLVRSSNHEAEIQSTRRCGGDSVAESVAADICELNARTVADSELGVIGGIVGADPGEARELLTRLPNALVSLPGLGRENRPPESFTPVLAEAQHRVLLPIQSGLLAAGSFGLSARIAEWKEALRRHELSP
jgi:orotidine-5'-phosphate decarboxylase